MPALRVSAVFGGAQDPAFDDWDTKFQQITGIVPDMDPNADEGNVEGLWTKTFVLYTEDGPYIFSSDDSARASVAQYKQDLRRGGLAPLPSEWAIIPTTKGKRLSVTQTQIIQKEMEEKGATPQQIQETLVKASEAIEGKEVLQPERAPRVRRGGPSRPARFRTLSREREWMEYVRPGETIPYWEQMGLHEVDPKEKVDEDLWRIVYKAWYATTPQARLSQQGYNRTKGRRIQSGWEKGINPLTQEFDPQMKGPATRAKYFKSDKGKAARAASNTRSKLRLKLGRALRAEEFSDKEIEWVQTINGPEIGGTGQTWISVIQEAWSRFDGIEISDDEIEIIFWEQGLRPLLKTQEDLQDWIHGKDTGRINPATGEELI